MKNYMANEQGGDIYYVYLTYAHAVYSMGREFEATGNPDVQYESLRLLGQALHTLEDLSTHQ